MTMDLSPRGLKRSCTPPTEETWAAAKRKMHDRAVRMSYGRKLEALSALLEGRPRWRKPRAEKRDANADAEE